VCMFVSICASQRERERGGGGDRQTDLKKIGHNDFRFSELKAEV
jgi:hypothetical protein